MWAKSGLLHWDREGLSFPSPLALGKRIRVQAHWQRPLIVTTVCPEEPVNFWHFRPVPTHSWEDDVADDKMEIPYSDDELKLSPDLVPSSFSASFCIFAFENAKWRIPLLSLRGGCGD